MSSSIYIKDSFGNRIPLLDAYGNISFEVVMLYSEDKLSAEDRKVVEALAQEDEMTRDVLAGYAKTGNSAKTYQHINQLGTLIEERTGADRVSYTPSSESGFDLRRIAAGVAVLLVLGTATYFIAQQFNENELADNEQIDSQEALFQLEMESDQTEEVAGAITSDSRGFKDGSKGSAEIESRSTATEQVQEKKALDLESAASDLKKVEQREEPTQKNIPVGTVASGADKVPSRGEVGAVTTVTTVQSGKAKSELMSSDDVLDLKRDRESSITREQESKNRQTSVPAAQEDMATNTSRVQSASDDEMNLDNGPAKYPGGDMAMYKFIEKKKNYTEAMKAQKISGKVTINFEIDENGRVQNATVVNGINGLADEDALRVVRSMPKWKPATENGVAVPSNKTVIVRYGE